MDISKYDCVMFDMDGTLAQSKGPISLDMAECLSLLLQNKKVAVISGGKFEQFEKQLISFIPKELWKNLFVLPTTGTALKSFEENSWITLYDESISEEERNKVIEILKTTLQEAGYQEKETFGEIIEDRGSQITFSGLGNSAPIKNKMLWDPYMEKRKHIISFLSPKLPEYTLTMGGMTSIDITKKGIDKAYGANRFSESLNIPISKILFIGDKLDVGGNDYPVKSTGIDTIAVKNPEETEFLIKGWFLK